MIHMQQSFMARTSHKRYQRKQTIPHDVQQSLRWCLESISLPRPAIGIGIEIWAFHLISIPNQEWEVPGLLFLFRLSVYRQVGSVIPWQTNANTTYTSTRISNIRAILHFESNLYVSKQKSMWWIKGNFSYGSEFNRLWWMITLVVNSYHS